MRAVIRRHLLVITALLAGGLCGCATPPPADDADAVADFNEANDPLEPTNRAFYAFNNGLDTVIFAPAAQAYRYLIPSPVRGGIHNVLVNLGTPVQLGNDILQAKPRRAGDTTMRFLINTTVGVLGFFDVAKDWGYPDHDSRLRHDPRALGCAGRAVSLPAYIRAFRSARCGRSGREHGYGPIHLGGSGCRGPGPQLVAQRHECGRPAGAGARRHRQIKKTALDPYATFRSLYRQHRQSAINDARNDKRATIPIWFPESRTPDTVTYSPAPSPVQ